MVYNPPGDEAEAAAGNVYEVQLAIVPNSFSDALHLQVQHPPEMFPARDVRSWTPAQLRAKWGARLRGYREEKERLRARGRNLSKIEKQIVDLQAKLDRLEKS